MLYKVLPVLGPVCLGIFSDSLSSASALDGGQIAIKCSYHMPILRPSESPRRKIAPHDIYNRSYVSAPTIYLQNQLGSLECVSCFQNRELQAMAG